MPAEAHGRVRLQGVAKRFGAEVALHELDLEIEGGATTVLIGPSGCGKSTLLRILVGLLVPDTGKVLIAGEELSQASMPRLRQRIGYVIQEGGLLPHLDARRNVTLMARWLGWARERCEARLQELCTLTRFSPEHLDRHPAELSGGQRQRVSLMRALLLDPEVLLLDEPLGALDPMIRADLQSELREIFRSLRKTTVMVTHDLGEAGWFADRIVLMRAGRIAQAGTLEELARQPAAPFVTDFLRAQSRNYASLAGLSA